MTDKINTYFALIIIIIAGTAAAMLIIHTANSTKLVQRVGGTEAGYASLQQLILNQ